MVQDAYRIARSILDKLTDLPPLLFRLILAYGFYGPAMKKVENFDSIVSWFGQMGIPFPTINAYMATATEISGVILLTLGLATRIISVPLMFVMVVAIATVHGKNGFAAGDNGFEIPLYYMLMLFSLVVTGAGRLSADHLIKRKVIDG